MEISTGAWLQLPVSLGAKSSLRTDRLKCGVSMACGVLPRRFPFKRGPVRSDPAGQALSITLDFLIGSAAQRQNPAVAGAPSSRLKEAILFFPKKEAKPVPMLLPPGLNALLFVCWPGISCPVKREKQRARKNERERRKETERGGEWERELEQEKERRLSQWSEGRHSGVGGGTTLLVLSDAD